MRRRRTTSHENGFGRQDLEAGSVSVVQAFMVGERSFFLCDDTDPAYETDPRR